jgi:hypothetical protein
VRQSRETPYLLQRPRFGTATRLRVMALAGKRNRGALVRLRRQRLLTSSLLVSPERLQKQYRRRELARAIHDSETTSLRLASTPTIGQGAGAEPGAPSCSARGSAGSGGAASPLNPRHPERQHCLDPRIDESVQCQALMHRGDPMAQYFRLDNRARVERCILERLGD